MLIHHAVSLTVYGDVFGVVGGLVASTTSGNSALTNFSSTVNHLKLMQQLLTTLKKATLN